MKKAFRFVFSFAVIMGLKLPELTAATVAAPANGKAKFEWDYRTEANFVRLVCDDDQYFRVCFSVGRRLCADTVKAEAHLCDLKLKSQIKKYDSETAYFADIGLCTGSSIENKWRDRKAILPKCDSKENWQ